MQIFDLDDRNNIQLIDKLNLPEEIKVKILKRNSKVEFDSISNYFFCIFSLAEYDKDRKSIRDCEVNVYYSNTENSAFVFVTNLKYFFKKYSDKFDIFNEESFQSFITKLFHVVFEDEQMILEHIMEDTNNIRAEYYSKADEEMLIRHLTNNQINISTLKLIVSNQNKFLDTIQHHIDKHLLYSIDYIKNSLISELIYLQEFCNALMNSINTKYEVKTSKDIYIWTKFTFIAIIGTFIFDLLDIFIRPDHSNIEFWLIAISIIAILGIFTIMRKAE